VILPHMHPVVRAPEEAAGGAPPDAPPPTSPADASLLDAAADTAVPPPDANGRATRPEWLPEQFWDGEKREIRQEALAKSWRDMRTQVARGDHKPPADENGYALPVIEGAPDNFVPADDPVWQETRRAALAAGVTAKQLAAIAAPLLANAVRHANEKPAAREDSPEAAEALRQAKEAEIGKLGPNGRALMRDVDGWLKGLAGNGILTGEELASVRGVSDAAGVRALAKLRELAGEKAIPVDALAGADATTQADAQRMMQEGFARNDSSLVARGREQLAALEKQGRLVIRGPGGAFRA